MANPMLFGKRCAPAVAEDESNTEVKYTGLDTRMSETVSSEQMQRGSEERAHM